MAPIWAVASLTIREAIRRRAFLVMAVFGVFLLASSAFFPAMTPEGQVRLVIVWSLRATTLFGILVVVFVSSLSLPLDIEEKRIFMIVTKPISRPALFLGKLLGFAILLAWFVVVMGALSLAYIYVVAKKAGTAGAPALLMRERLEAPCARMVREGVEESSFSLEEPPRIWALRPGLDFATWNFRGIVFTPLPPGCVGRTLSVAIRVHLQPRPPGGAARAKLRVMAYTHLKSPDQLMKSFLWKEVEDGGVLAFDIVPDSFGYEAGDMRVAILQPPDSPGCLGVSPLDAYAEIVNTFRDGHTEVEYHYDAFSCTIGGKYLENLAETELETYYNVKSDLYAQVVHEQKVVARWEFAGLDASDFDREATVEIRLPIKAPMLKFGYLIVTVRDPAGNVLDRRKLRVPANEPVTIPLDPAWVAKGAIAVEVERGEPDTILTVVPGGVALRTRGVTFAYAYAGALVMSYLLLLLLLAIILPCSTWLSGPVSLFVGIAFFLFGLSLQSVHENIIHVESVIRTTEVVEAMGGEEGHHHSGAEVPLWALRASKFLLQHIVLRLFPEIDRFETIDFLERGTVIPLRRIGSATLYVFLYTLATSILASLILRFREFR